MWWDPNVLALKAAPAFGLRHEELIRDTEPGIVAAGRRAYEEWRLERDSLVERARHPAITVETVVERARRNGADLAQAAQGVAIVDTALGVDHPGGRRFGALIHAVLASVPLDATHEQIAVVVDTQARILAAPAAEADACRLLVERLLHHPVLQPARAAWKAGKCRRETPVSWMAPDGALVEGVLDVAFEGPGGWTILDFKTDKDLENAEDQYRGQAALYMMALTEATGKAARAFLVRV
jgi:ATP-dependent exoDNAse (exonuclease V) beta subunit